MQLCGLYSGTGAATLAIERSSMTKEHSVCRTPIHLVTRQNHDTRSIIFAGQLRRTESLVINARLVHFCSATCPNISPPLTRGARRSQLGEPGGILDCTGVKFDTPPAVLVAPNGYKGSRPASTSVEDETPSHPGGCLWQWSLAST